MKQKLEGSKKLLLQKQTIATLTIVTKKHAAHTTDLPTGGTGGSTLPMCLERK
jgi:hypothetical protein